MRVQVLLAAIVVATFCAASNGKHSSNNKQEWDFASNQKLEIHVTDADVNVKQSDGEKVIVELLTQSDSTDFADKVKASFQVQGNTGVLTVAQPPRGGDLSVTVRVPPGTSLWLRSRAGDIDIETVGNKDIQTGAGDVRVTIGSSKKFGLVDVGTHAGDVSGDVCGKPKGWVGHSLHCTGDGKDEVRVHTNAGDVQLRESAQNTEKD